MEENKRQTNREYAQDNKSFKEHCQKAQVEPTKRQASKYRRGRGLAYTKGKK